MPIDKPEAVPTTRRTFLTRAALAGALVTVGTTAGPLTRLLPAAGAQDGTSDTTPELTDGDFADYVLPIELAAVQCYQYALAGDALGAEWSRVGLIFQTHHQAAVDTLTTLVPVTTPPAPDALPDPTVLQGTGAAIQAAGDEATVLGALAELEDVLAATHLYALGGLVDATTAKIVAQVMAVESQHAVALGRATGTAVDELTPDTASLDGARTSATSAIPGLGRSTTTTTAEGGN